jgi:CheY-like chemotaxis protein
MTNKILIIEDDKYLSEDMKSILELFDYETQIINDVDELVEITDFKSFHKIFLDIMMRTDGALHMNDFNESGEAALSYIRSKNRTTKVIVMSAMDQEDINIDFSLPNVKYVKKPFSGMDQLLELVKEQ